MREPLRADGTGAEGEHVVSSSDKAAASLVMNEESVEEEAADVEEGVDAVDVEEIVSEREETEVDGEMEGGRAEAEEGDVEFLPNI